MPQKSYSKFKKELTLRSRCRPGEVFSELLTTTNFSFQIGASHPEEFVEEGASLGYCAIGIADHNSLAGVVRAHVAAKEIGLPIRIGARIKLPHEQGVISPHLVLYPTNRASYGALCRLLTTGKLRAKSADPILTIDEVIKMSKDMVIIIAPYLEASGYDPEGYHSGLSNTLKLLVEQVDREMLSLGISRSYQIHATYLNSTLKNLSDYFKVKLLATNDPLFHCSNRKRLHDVLTCIKNGVTLSQAGTSLLQNGERYLKPPEEMVRLFRDLPGAIKRTVEVTKITEGFSLDLLKYEYPDEITPPGITPFDYLSRLTFNGARTRYPTGVPSEILNLIHQELHLIRELQYERYFLTCYEIVKFARSQNILCQGRGAAANSIVCFCLGITSVNPEHIELLFARFVSKERNEPPDIDIDFEHERREEVIQFIYRRFGRDRAGLTCAVSTYRHRSAVRDVGKALGLGNDTVDRLAKMIHRWTGSEISSEDLIESGINPSDPTITELIHLSRELYGFPRHLTQHVGGFIISQYPISETVPILNAAMEERTIIEWDKDDIDALGMLKVDVLALGMLTCLRKSLEIINSAHSRTDSPPITLASIPGEDPAVYKMICSADTIGVFQIESRAQMSMLPRLRPKTFYDLVIEVAIVRPGPIQGNMVHPYLKRRAGLEEPFYPDIRVEKVLGKTLGVPLFQEQAMRLAIVMANFTPGEAEQLRRAMAAWKRDKGKIATFRERIIKGMRSNGYSVQFAETCVEQMKGFSEYGFPESHAASFALLVYASAWIKFYYPAVFCTSLINSQPMGFYGPSQLIQDAIQHGVEILPIDINHSSWDLTIENFPNTIRLGFRMITGVKDSEISKIAMLREELGSFRSIEELWNSTTRYNLRIQRETLNLIAQADGFRSLGIDSREALWTIAALPSQPSLMDPLFQYQERAANLPLKSQQELMLCDYQTTNISLRGHPIQFVREDLAKAGVVTATEIRTRGIKCGSNIRVAGIAICRQRPGTAKGVVFVTLEDETGHINLIIKPPIFERFHQIIIHDSALAAQGVLERVDGVIYVNPNTITTLDDLIPSPIVKELMNKSYSY